MRRATILCFLMASFMAIGFADARMTRRGWLQDAWNSVKDAVKSAGTWVKENCTVGIPSGVSCNLNGRRRQAGPEIISDTLASLNKICTEIGLSPNQNLKDVVEAAYEEADENNDGVLDVKEAAMFNEIILVLSYCAERNN